jgi:heme-degrading monooxygenase HmoA
MHCRVLEGKARAGRVAEALEVVNQQVQKVRGVGGFLFVQAMHSGDDVIVVSSWRTDKDLHAYADSQLAQEMLARLSPLFAEGPTVKNFVMALAVEGDEGFFPRDEGGEG